MNWESASTAFREFLAVIKALRTPGTGCPWDLEQDHQTLRRYLIEEAYEVIEAIDQGKDHAFQEELGDLLLQVVLHAQVAADRQAFTITEVIRGIHDKMVRRHPHVFGDVQVSGSAEVLRNWEQIKAAEKSAGSPPPGDTLARVPQSLPALLGAQRLASKAAKMGIDPALDNQGLDAMRGQLGELETAVAANDLSEERRAQLEHVLGDLLFGLCQASRRLGLDAEECLRMRNRQFVEQFQKAECDSGN